MAIFRCPSPSIDISFSIYLLGTLENVIQTKFYAIQIFYSSYGHALGNVVKHDKFDIPVICLLLLWLLDLVSYKLQKLINKYIFFEYISFSFAYSQCIFRLFVTVKSILIIFINFLIS